MNITQLFVFPIKSCRGIAMPALQVQGCGAEWDRRWMLVDEDGVFLSQRQLARMTLIQTVLDGDGLRVSLSSVDGAPSLSSVGFSKADFASSSRIRVRVWRDTCEALVGPDWLNDWFSSALARSCRIVWMDEQLQRPVNPEYAGKGETVSFADGFPYLMANTASVQDLNRHLSQGIDVERFRPNLVVGGQVPWEEDHWWGIEVGTVRFQLVKPSSRCVIPSIDPETGIKQPEVFKTLQQQRKGEDGQVYFGHNLLPLNSGQIRVGDPVQVIGPEV